MLIKIPLNYKAPVDSDVDYEGLGIKAPEGDLVEHDAFIESDEIYCVEPDISSGKGSFVYFLNHCWNSTMEVEELVNLINEAKFNERSIIPSNI